MKTAWSIVWKLVLILCVAGLIILGISWAKGGFGPLSIGSGGIHPANTHDQHIDEQSLDAFTTIDVNTETMAISIVTGDHYGLKVDATNTPRTITWSNKSGTLQLRQSSSSEVNLTLEKVTAVITVPSSAALKSVSVQSAAAKVSVAADCGTLTVQTSAGLIDVSGSVSGNATITSDAGAITMSGAVKGDAKVSSSAGAITVSGTTGSITAATQAGVVTINGASPAIDVRSTVGAVNVTVPGTWASTNYQLSATIGNITTSGTGAPGQANFGTKQGGPASGYDLLLKVETTVGAITVNLGS